MGFDLYGNNPNAVGVRPEIDWTKDPSDAEAEKFFKDLDKFEADNPGAYFRNNVWFWRPLWHFICDVVAPKLLTKEDKTRGEYNDGHFITAIKAIYIADRISELDEQGVLDEYQLKYEDSIEKLPLVMCDLCGGSGTRNDEHVQGKCNGCDGNGERKQFASSYPFSAENVREFAKFAKASGGFRIT